MVAVIGAQCPTGKAAMTQQEEQLLNGLIELLLVHLHHTEWTKFLAVKLREQDVGTVQ